MENLSYRIGRIGCAAGAVLLAGCGLTGMGGTTGGHTTGPPVTITQATAPSALLAVTAGGHPARLSPTWWPALPGRTKTSASCRR